VATTAATINQCQQKIATGIHTKNSSNWQQATITLLSTSNNSLMDWSTATGSWVPCPSRRMASATVWKMRYRVAMATQCFLILSCHSWLHCDAVAITLHCHACHSITIIVIWLSFLVSLSLLFLLPATTWQQLLPSRQHFRQILLW